MKTIKVEITREDGSIIRVLGEEADKWQKAVEGQASFCAVHNNPFPELKWEHIAPEVPLYEQSWFRKWFGVR